MSRQVVPSQAAGVPASGSTGQVLAKNSATSYDTAWQTLNPGATAVGGDLSGTVANAQIVANAVGTTELADGSVTTAKIADGTIATADLANSAVTNAKLASDTARANLLTNGGFEIWQRGAGPFTATNTYCADRWLLALAGTDTLTVTQNTPSADGTFGSLTCAGCVFTLGSGAGASGLRQDLPNTDKQQLRGRTATLSVRVYTTIANAVRIGVFSDGTGGTTTYSSYHPGTSAYVTLSVTTTFPSDATAFYMLVRFAASCTAYIDNAMLVVGSVPADYAPLHPADDLARCLRYYERLGSYSAQYPVFTGHNASGAGVIVHASIPYSARKSVFPTITKNGTWGVTNSGQPTSASLDTAGCAYTITSLAAGFFNAYAVDATTYFSIEANP